MSVESDLAEHLWLLIAETNEKLAKSLSEESGVHPSTPDGDDAVNDPHAAKVWAMLAAQAQAATKAQDVVAPAPDPLIAVNERLERLEGQFKAVDERINWLASMVVIESAKKL